MVYLSNVLCILLKCVMQLIINDFALGQMGKEINYLIERIRTSLCSSKLKPRCHYDRTYWYKRRQKTVHCSLLSSTNSMDRSGELRDFEYGLVIGCHTSKKSSCQNQWLVMS
jgi:hypothetical protein